MIKKKEQHKFTIAPQKSHYFVCALVVMERQQLRRARWETPRSGDFWRGRVKGRRLRPGGFEQASDLVRFCTLERGRIRPLKSRTQPLVSHGVARYSTGLAKPDGALT
jgi:hypothetical protein